MWAESFLEPNMHYARLSSSKQTCTPRLHVGSRTPTMFPTVITTMQTLGAGSETNCSNSNTPPSTHRRTIYNILSVATSGILQTTNAKAIYTFKFTILKSTSVSDAIQKTRNYYLHTYSTIHDYYLCNYSKLHHYYLRTDSF